MKNAKSPSSPAHRRGIGAGAGKGLSRPQLPRSSPPRARSCRAAIPTSLAVAGDVGDPATAERVVAEAMSRFGRIDTLVEQCRHLHRQALHRPHARRDFAGSVATNLAGFFHFTQAVVAEMLKQESGHIVSITTSLSRPGRLPACPPALANLHQGRGSTLATKSLAIEYAQQGHPGERGRRRASSRRRCTPGDARLPGDASTR